MKNAIPTWKFTRKMSGYRRMAFLQVLYFLLFSLSFLRFYVVSCVYMFSIHLRLSNKHHFTRGIEVPMVSPKFKRKNVKPQYQLRNTSSYKKITPLATSVNAIHGQLSNIEYIDIPFT